MPNSLNAKETIVILPNFESVYSHATHKTVLYFYAVHVFLCQMNHFIYKSFYPFTWTWQEKGAIEKTSMLIKFSECINKLTSQKSKKWNGRHTVFVSLPNSSLCRWWVHLFQDKKVGLALDLFDIIVHLFIWLIEMEVFFVCLFLLH